MNNIKKIPFKQRLNTWLQFRKKMFLLWWANAPQYQKDLEKGIYYLRKGALFQVGQPFKIRDSKSGKIRTRYIENLFFNFRTNCVTHKFSEKPIAGLTDQFISKKGK